MVLDIIRGSVTSLTVQFSIICQTKAFKVMNVFHSCDHVGHLAFD